jgi:hypothetical protein
MVVSFEFFATHDPPRNNALSEGFDSLLRARSKLTYHFKRRCMPSDNAVNTRNIECLVTHKFSYPLSTAV